LTEYSSAGALCRGATGGAAPSMNARTSGAVMSAKPEAPLPQPPSGA